MKKAKKFYRRQVKSFKLYCRDNRQSAISMTLVILISFLAVGTVNVRAAARYTPGQILNPECGPTDPDCAVSAPAFSGANSDITSLSGLASLTSGGATIGSLTATSSATFSYLSSGSLAARLRQPEQG